MNDNGRNPKIGGRQANQETKEDNPMIRGKRAVTKLFTAMLIVTAGLVLQAADPIQTQMSSDTNFEVDLMRLTVNDDVLTVVIMVRNTSGAQALFRVRISGIYYLETGAGKKYHVLKDSKDVWIAEPHGRDGLSTYIKANGRQLYWMKFPAPPPSAKKISIVIPIVLPFENVPLPQ